MNAVVNKTITLTADWQRLSAVSLVASVAIAALHTNAASAEFRVNGGSAQEWPVGGSFPFTSIDLYHIEVRGEPGDKIVIAGDAVAMPREVTPVQATSIVLSSITTTTLTATATRGNLAGILVLVKEASAGDVSEEPWSDVDISEAIEDANANFAAAPDFGDDIAEAGTSGWRLVYAGTGNSVNVTGLTVGHQYVFVFLETNLADFTLLDVATGNPVGVVMSGSQIIAMGNTNKSVDAWSAVGDLGGDKVVCVALPNDEASTYIQSTAQNQMQGFYPAAHTIHPSVQITSLTATRRHMRAGGASGFCTGVVVFGGNTTALGTIVPGASWADSTSGNLARPGGGSWVVADIANTEWRVTCTHASNRTLITSFYANAAWQGVQIAL